jgi:cob(I)alamin adenosyltransferase
MKIYTKTGDKGTTGLYGGQRVAKNAPRIQAYGEVDELNAVLGLVRAETTHAPIQQALLEIQNTLFVMGAQLASPRVDPKIEIITSAHVDFLERQIDVITETLPPLKHFILPGGSRTAAQLHLARTVCRRAERSTVTLSQLPNEVVDTWVLIYLNRLSDFLFVLGRLANQLEKIEDTLWLPKGKN